MFDGAWKKIDAKIFWDLAEDKMLVFETQSEEYISKAVIKMKIFVNFSVIF